MNLNHGFNEVSHQLYENNLDIILFIYGLSFLIMGIAILTQPKKDSKFKIAKILWLLVVYAFIHALGDFLDMWTMIKNDNVLLHQLYQILTYIAYIFLFEFGRRLLGLTKKEIAWWILPIIILGIFGISVLTNDFQTNFNILIGYFIRFPAGVMAGIGFILYYNSEKETLKALNVKKYFFWAAISFLAWAVLCGIFRAKGEFFPANWLNAESFCSTITLPVHLFRAICAIIIVWAIIGMLQIFNWEMFKKLKVSQVEIEQQLKDTETKYMDILENSSDIIQSVDENGFIVSVNKNGCELLGYSKEKFPGKHIKEIYAPETWENMIKGFEILKQQGSLFVPDAKMIKKNGEKLDVEIQSLAIYDNKGNFIKTRSIIRNITERKKTEDTLKKTEEQLLQSQKMEAIGRLAGGVAHDFNNLLTVIIGYADILLAGCNENDKESIEEIKKSADRATSLTRQLLAFSRKQVLQPKELNINNLVSDMSKMLLRLIGEDIELITNQASDIGTVKVDQGQLEQVILNIAINARDAMPKGGKLIIETTNMKLDKNSSKKYIGVKEGHYVMLAISDTGEGIPKEIIPYIFEPFFTTKEKGKGTGLGLSTVYGIIKQSGGYIWVYSEPNRGTTFKIYLPKIEEIEKESPLLFIPYEIPKGTKTILLVEDEDSVRRLSRLLLQKNGYNVLEAHNGTEALNISEKYNGIINLMVTDVVMPQMSGPELLKILSPLRPAIKVLYMSGYTDEAIVRHGVLQEGINFIQKPFTLDSFLRKIHEVLNK